MFEIVTFSLSENSAEPLRVFPSRLLYCGAIKAVTDALLFDLDITRKEFEDKIKRVQKVNENYCYIKKEI